MDKKEVDDVLKTRIYKGTAVVPIRHYKPYMDRETFMKYWRMEGWIEDNLTADDRMEIFMEAPVGSSDLTFKTLTELVSNFDGGKRDFIITQDIGEFCVLTVMREDIEEHYEDIPEKVIDSISDEKMLLLADKMSDFIQANDGFVLALQYVVESEDSILSETSICCECGCDTLHEGFVNRISYEGHYNDKKKQGEKFPHGGYFCGPCQLSMDDDVDCDHCEVTISREESHDVGKETVCGDCYVKIETDEHGKPV